MKFQIYAISLRAACEAYIAARDKERADFREGAIQALMRPISQPNIVTYELHPHFIFWTKKVRVETPSPAYVRTRQEAESYYAQNLYDNSPQQNYATQLQSYIC